MCWNVFLLICSLRETILSLRKRFAQYWPRPHCADVMTAQIWKSLHIVAAIATAVLTREREISTCPNHIPALTQNNTHLHCELKPNPLSSATKTHRSHWETSFRYLDCEIQETGDCRAVSLDQMWRSMRYSRNLKCLSWIIWHRSFKTWHITGKSREKKVKIGVQPTLWLCSIARCQEGRIMSQCYKTDSLDLD